MQFSKNNFILFKKFIFIFVCENEHSAIFGWNEKDTRESS